MAVTWKLYVQKSNIVDTSNIELHGMHSAWGTAVIVDLMMISTVKQTKTTGWSIVNICKIK